MICRKSAPSLSYLPVFLTMSELFYSDMVHFSGSHGALKEKGACGEKPRALAAALRASNLQVCPHTTLLPYKKPVSTCVNTGLTCMLCGASSPQPLALAATRLPCQPAPATCTYAKRSTPSLETRAKNSGSSSGVFSPKTRASRKMRSPSSRRLSSPVRSVAITSPFST